MTILSEEPLLSAADDLVTHTDALPASPEIRHPNIDPTQYSPDEPTTPLAPALDLIFYLGCFIAHGLISLLWYSINIVPRATDTPETTTTWFFHWVFNLILAVLGATAIGIPVYLIAVGTKHGGFLCAFGSVVGASAALAGMLQAGWQVQVWYEWAFWASLGVFPGSVPVVLLISGLRTWNGEDWWAAKDNEEAAVSESDVQSTKNEAVGLTKTIYESDIV